MELKTHLKSIGLRQTKFAVVVGISDGYLSDILNGKVTPGLDLAVRIEDATGGKITARSWIITTPPTNSFRTDGASGVVKGVE